MKAAATILLVEDDPAALAAFERVLAREGSFRVVTAHDGLEGWEKARAVRPDLIISDYQMPYMDGFELCKRIKADEATAGAPFVVLTAYGETSLKVKGLGLGVDDYLTKPIEMPELIARVRAALRIKGLLDRTRADQEALAALNERLEQSFENLVTVLVHILDLRVPGAAHRGTRLAQMARRMAERLGVPDEYLPDLGMAARLHEIGRVGEPHDGADTDEVGINCLVGGCKWTYLLDAAAMIRQVGRLEPAAELVLQIGEHWDGTGLPAHRRKGQIPLRSRILRVLIDFFALLDAGNGRDVKEQATAEIARHAGTRYDPAVVAQLEAMLVDTPAAALPRKRREVLVTDLEPGMVLAEDIVTSSGVKLLAHGATITDAMRLIILRRHQLDPILGGIWIQH
ncbi:MAG TPA: response regulator [Gemmatimonadales bacterium]|nr:response regulator [Gemmatimonadales bacterium]